VRPNPGMIVGMAIAVLCLAGCANMATDRYASSVDNVVALRPYAASQVNVGQFTSSVPGKNAIGCRLGAPILTPDGEPFSEYIRKALSDELKLANAYSANSPVTLSGNLDLIDFSSNTGKWDLGITLRSSNGHSLKASTEHKFVTSFGGDTACAQTAQAFMPAVQDLIRQTIESPEFSALFKQ